MYGSGNLRRGLGRDSRAMPLALLRLKPVLQAALCYQTADASQAASTVPLGEPNRCSFTRLYTALSICVYLIGSKKTR